MGPGRTNAACLSRRRLETEGGRLFDPAVLQCRKPHRLVPKERQCGEYGQKAFHRSPVHGRPRKSLSPLASATHRQASRPACRRTRAIGLKFIKFNTIDLIRGNRVCDNSRLSSRLWRRTSESLPERLCSAPLAPPPRTGSRAGSSFDFANDVPQNSRPSRVGP